MERTFLVMSVFMMLIFILLLIIVTLFVFSTTSDPGERKRKIQFLISKFLLFFTDMLLVGRWTMVELDISMFWIFSNIKSAASSTWRLLKMTLSTLIKDICNVCFSAKSVSNIMKSMTTLPHLLMSNLILDALMLTRSSPNSRSGQALMETDST